MTKAARARGKRKCNDCGRKYSPMLRAKGYMPRGYRICPKCKSKKTEWNV